MKKNIKFLFPVSMCILIGWLVYFAMISNVTNITGWDLSMAAQLAGADGGSFAWNLMYSFIDIAEGPVFTDFFACIGMFAGAAAGWYLEKIGSPLAGTGVAGANKVFGWLVGAQVVAVFGANLFWRYAFGVYSGWFCSFVPLVSITPLAILCYGQPTIKKALTGIVLGILISVPLTQAIINILPAGWGAFCGLGLGMPTATIIGMELMKLLPWMKEQPAVEEELPVPAVSDKCAEVKNSAAYLTVVRVFGGDFSELYFWGASWSGFGAYVGSFISYILNPVGGAGLPFTMFTMLLASAIGMLFWGPRYQEKGFAFTMEGVLMIGVTGTIIFAWGGWAALIGFTVLSEIIGPASIHWALEQKFFQRYAACVPIQYFAGIWTIIVSFICVGL